MPGKALVTEIEKSEIFDSGKVYKCLFNDGSLLSFESKTYNVFPTGNSYLKYIGRT